MATDTYAYYYQVTSGTPPADVTLGSRIDGPTNIIEADGTDDSSTAVTQFIQTSAFGGTGTLVGLTSTGEPIINYGGFGTWVFTDDSTLAGQTISATTDSPYIFCFAVGSMIRTPAGETAVECLRIGEHVLTASGRAVPVKWVGRQTVATQFRPADRLTLVRVSAGALGGGLPHADLTLTADHALLIDNVLCNAGALVNGTTITPVPFAELGERFTVYHVETEAHEIILANGAPAETFIDNVSRRVFDNYAEFEALYGDVPEMQELPFARAMSPRQVPAGVRNKLKDRTAA
ncbi:Hint domain-containing protein [Seohaeicola saemankumensis]|nr:Hint domain-containing protein [Seohaeicola saemankumensis]MCA0872320.1 Hint domain-containing protein [Seohaeicola saemankumensis]